MKKASICPPHLRFSFGAEQLKCWVVNLQVFKTLLTIGAHDSANWSLDRFGNKLFPKFASNALADLAGIRAHPDRDIIRLLRRLGNNFANCHASCLDEQIYWSSVYNFRTMFQHLRIDAAIPFLAFAGSTDE